MVADLVLWESRYGSVIKGKRTMALVDKLARDSGLEKEDLAGAMRDRSFKAGVMAATISRHNSTPP